MKIYLITIAILAFWATGFGQQPGLDIPFVENLPVIDGLPDESLNRITWQNFPYSEKSNNSNPDLACRYQGKRI